MAKGGYRPGAGRPKGSRNKTRLETQADIQSAAAFENMTPLDYMLKVMRDQREDAGRRDRMAIAAAPFCHVRKGEGNGKTEKINRATIAGGGKFAPMKPPLKLVK
jgi:hypothetical protein